MYRSNTQGVWGLFKIGRKVLHPPCLTRRSCLNVIFNVPTSCKDACTRVETLVHKFVYRSASQLREFLREFLSDDIYVAIQAIHLLSLSTGAIDSCTPSICKLANSAPTFHLRMPHVQSCASDGWLPNQCRGQNFYDPFSSIFHMPAWGAS